MPPQQFFSWIIALISVILATSQRPITSQRSRPFRNRLQLERRIYNLQRQLFFCRNSLEALQDTMSGLFHTPEQIEKVTNQTLTATAETLPDGSEVCFTTSPLMSSDLRRAPPAATASLVLRSRRILEATSASCCQTNYYHVVFNRINIKGIKYDTINLSSSYQFVPVGDCLLGATCFQGNCIQRQRIHFLAIWNDSLPGQIFTPQFVSHEVNSHCECVNTLV